MQGQKHRNNIVIETERLYLREFVTGDASSLYQLNLDEEVMRYTGDEPFASPDNARLFIENYDHYRKYGYGRWAVISKADDKFIGWCGLKYTPDIKECDAGFRFFKSQWHKGYATEAAQAVLHYGFARHLLPRIVGRAMKDNPASIAVLKKIGMSYLQAIELGGQPAVLYYCENPSILVSLA